ncbi:MAG TPA: hypothetical protein PLB10_18035 [Thiolinea sp.]|nr:hypothetical protein [Thiolinea sp.]
MKTFITGLSLAGLLAVSAAFAAPDSAAITQRVEQLKSEFNLTDQQTQRLQSMLDTAANQSPEDRQARQQARQERLMDRRLKRMQERLGLNDEQVSQFKTLMSNHMAQMKAMQEEHKKQMEAILTPEQLTKMQDMRSSMQRRGMHGQGMRGKGRMGGMMCGGHKGGWSKNKPAKQDDSATPENTPN